ncbi:restriction endonuclease subunit S [Bacillus cereus]|nr:restriction endonuclease subunit S [Bacillus cereus]MEB9887636.1 restriction endonuclease subunit S [Bacillus cereus]
MSENEKLVPKRRFKEFKNADIWEQRKVSDFAEETYGGGTPKTSVEEYWNGNLPWIQSSDLNEHQSSFKTARKKITESGLNNSATKLVPANSIAIVTRVGVGKLAFMPFDYATSQDFLSLSKLKVDEWFGVYSLYKKLQSELHAVQGTSIKGITKEELLNKKVMVPLSKDEQEKIGTFFRSLDDLIASQQRKLNKIKAMKSAYLSEMFPTAGERKPKRRFAGFTDDWEQRTIGEFGSFYYGKSAPKWSVTSDATTPCVRYGELYTKHKEKIDTIYSFTNIPKENLKFSTGKEVLVPRVGEDPLDFANCSWLSIPGVAIGEMISVYNTKQNPLFTAYMFNALFKYEFAKRVEGGNVSNLYYAYLENIPVSYPSLEEQDKIASFFDNLSTLIAFQQRKLEKLQNIKKAYLNEMFI